MTMLWYTPGPVSSDLVNEIIAAGATGARLTFSYSTPEYQAGLAREHRRIAEQIGKEFMTVADLAGEKFRLGKLAPGDTLVVDDGQILTLTSHPQDITDIGNLPVTDPKFFSNISPKDHVTVGDGGARLEVLTVDRTRGTATTVACGSGSINSTRGLTVEGFGFRPQSLTPKDISDLKYIGASGLFDAVALSFVSSADDIAVARRVLSGLGTSLPIVAKVETAAGVENASEIAEAADMLMVARGDLALALPWVELPWAADKIVDAAEAASKPWIIATQVVEGVERFVMPTRAEICDLARWLDRGCNGVMTSYETAFGSNPIGAVRSVHSLIARWSSSGLTVKP